MTLKWTPYEQFVSGNNCSHAAAQPYNLHVTMTQI